MPEETLWASFFDAEAALARLWPQPAGDVVELGCGFGTFTLAAARRTDGIVTALDIDPAMIATVSTKAKTYALGNIRPREHDFVTQGIDVSPGSQSHAMVYNLLHMEQPVQLLREVRRVLKSEGAISVMHWRTDIPTPRGPSLEIRPAPEDCAAWLAEAGFTRIAHVNLGDSCPFHYGLTAWRTA